MSKHRLSPSRLSKAFSLGVLFAALSTSAMAQVVITDVTYAGPASPSGAGSTDMLDFSGYQKHVATVTAEGVTYNVNAVASPSVFVRRTSTIGSYGTQLAFQSNGPSSTYSSQYAKLDSLLASGNSYVAFNNAFKNGIGSNVERIDAYFGAATTVQSTDALSLFGLNVSAGDTFRIALITGWDGAGSAPSAYFEQTLLVKVSDLGVLTTLATPGVAVPSGGPGANYQLAGYASSNNLAGGPDAVSLEVNATLSGVLVRFSDFFPSGSSPFPSEGLSILGYSVMAGDGTVNSGSDLLSPINNTVVYSNTTGLAGGGTGFNFSGFNSAIASPVPEPSTYGLLLTGGSLGFFAWRRRRLNRAQVKA